MKPDLPEPIFLSVPEAGRICGVSRNTVYLWVRQGKLGAYQTPGRTNKIRPSDLARFLQDNGMFVPPDLIALAARDENEVGEAVGEPAGPDTTLPEVLVVDDDPLIRSLAVRALRDHAVVHQAETGYQALHLVTAHPGVEVVLLDLRMPGQHGLDTLRELVRLNPDIRVVVVSGFCNELPAEWLRSGTVTAVVEKPVTVQDLRQAVESASQKV